MIEIPENLPEKLYPLAWMIGSWRGYGTIGADFLAVNNYPGAPASDQMIIQDMEVLAAGEQLHVEVVTYSATGVADVPVGASATEGLRLLQRGEQLWSETQRWSVVNYQLGSAEEPTPAAVVDIEITNSPVASRWEARTLGPRVSARALGGHDWEATRMIGLVGGEFFWAQDRMLAAMDAGETEFSARLARTGGEA